MEIFLSDSVPKDKKILPDPCLEKSVLAFGVCHAAHGSAKPKSLAEHMKLCLQSVVCYTSLKLAFFEKELNPQNELCRFTYAEAKTTCH